MKQLMASMNYVIQPRANITFSNDDRGVRFGDGVFETIAILQGHPYLWREHIARLKRGLTLLRIDADLSCLEDNISELVALNNVTQGMARIMITRGCGSQGYLPTHATPPNIFVEVHSCDVLHHGNNNPIRLYCSRWRRFPPDVLPTDAKINQGMNATLARMEATDHHCDEALLLSVHNRISEAASGNLFWKKNDVIYTSCLSTGCLRGTMRERLIVLLRENGETLQEIAEPLETLGTCNAVIMTNAMRGAVPISSVIYHDETSKKTLAFNNSDRFAQQCSALIEKDVAQECRAA